MVRNISLTVSNQPSPLPAPVSQRTGAAGWARPTDEPNQTEPNTMDFSTEDRTAQIDFLNAPNTPDGYTVKIQADETGLNIEVLRPHGEEASTWDFFEFSVPVEAPTDKREEALEALHRLFPLEHGNPDVAAIWAYLESQAK